MKTKFFALLLATFAFTIAFAQKPQRVKGYTKKDGTYVAPSVRTKGNKTPNRQLFYKRKLKPLLWKEGY
jgi:hypothetical protein